jgi:hypothetical protein
MPTPTTTTFLAAPGVSAAFRASIDKALADIPAGAKAAALLSGEYTSGGRPVIVVSAAVRTGKGWTVAAYLKTDVKDITVGTEVKKVWR